MCLSFVAGVFLVVKMVVDENLLNLNLVEYISPDLANSAYGLVGYMKYQVIFRAISQANCYIIC